MKFSVSFKTVCSLSMALLMTNAPAVALAESHMISTSSIVEQWDRAQAEKNIQDLIQQEEVKNALLEKGVSPEEVSARLATLSESELKQLAGQVQEARAGGSILVEILLVVLIIYLIKRI